MATKESLNDARTPSTLQKIVTLRIERLGDDSRGILQSAAIIGTNFEYKLLGELIGPMSMGLLDASLKELEKLDFICEKSKFPKRIFQFKNSLVRDVVYNFIPPHKKIKIHSEIAAYLEGFYSTDLDEHVTLVASHYLRSDCIEKAIKYSFRAGEVLLKNYKLREALDFFLKSCDLLSDNEVPIRYLDLKKKIFKYKCEIYLLLGNYDLALSSLNFLKGLLSKDDFEDALEIKRMAAEILVEKGEFQKAWGVLNELLEVCRVRHLDTILIKVLKLMAFINIFRENIEETRKICEEGLFLCPESDERERGHFLTFLGFAEYHTNEYIKALAYFNKAFDIFQILGDKGLIGKTYCNIGMVHFKNGKYEEALRYYQLSSNILRNIEYRRAYAITRMNLAVLYDHMGDYENALSEYNAVLEESEEIGSSRVLMMVLCNLGEVFTRLGQFKISQRYLKDSISFSNQIGSIFWKINGLLYLGISNAEAGNLSAAQILFEESLRLSKEIGSRSKELEIRLELLKVALDKKETLERLRTFYNEVCDNKNLGLSENMRLKTLLLLGMAELKHGDFHTAQKYLEEGISLSNKQNNREFIFSFSLSLAKCFDSLKSSKLAKENIRRTNQTFAEIMGKIPENSRKFYRRKSIVMGFFKLLNKYNMKEKTFKEGYSNEPTQKSY